METASHGRRASAAVLPSAPPADARGSTARRLMGKDGVTVATRRRRGAVRPDLEEVFRTTYPRVVGVAARVLGAWDEAEDVAQDVFLAFGRSSVPAGDAPGWLSVAAAHTALNQIRSGRRRVAREGAADNGELVSPDTADAVVSRDERQRVRSGLARLPRRQAVALILRHSGMSYAEVAAALDLSPGSVGTTLRRAEFALGKELNRHASSE
jgi:RNA polymerase sigma factor (sigma-70 family)